MSKFGCFNGLTCLQPPVSCSLWGTNFAMPLRVVEAFSGKGCWRPHMAPKKVPPPPSSFYRLQDLSSKWRGG